MTTTDKAEAGTQESYLAPLQPDGTIMAPTADQFANATWMHVSPHIRKLVDDMIGEWKEFEDLRFIPYDIVWRRNGKPMRNNDIPVYATVDITPPRWVWTANDMGKDLPDGVNFPKFVVDLRWGHFDDLRRGREPGERDGDIPEGRATMYVHERILQQHVHHALMGLYVENDIVHRNQPDFTGFAETVRRFGQWEAGIVAVANQLSLFAQHTSNERPLHIQGPGLK